MQKLSIVNVLRLPSGVRVMMEEVGVFGEVAKFVHVIGIENLVHRADALLPTSRYRDRSC
jgi:hypothetical protein